MSFLIFSYFYIYHSIFLFLIIYFISNRTLPRRRNRVRHTAPFSWKRCLLERNNIYAEQFVWRRKPPVPGKCAHSSCCSRNNGPEKGTRISKSHNYWLRHWSIDEKPWKSLVIADTNILRCKTSGVNVTSLVGPVTIENVTVQNTSHGDGLVFRHNIDIMDFCSNISQLPSFPLVFNASGATFCSKVRGNVGVANFIIMNFWLALPSLLTQFEPQPPHSPLQNSSITSKPFKLGPPILATFPKIEKSSRRVRQHCC